jgi:hypothetical protein
LEPVYTHDRPNACLLGICCWPAHDLRNVTMFPNSSIHNSSKLLSKSHFLTSFHFITHTSLLFILNPPLSPRSSSSFSPLLDTYVSFKYLIDILSSPPAPPLYSPHLLCHPASLAVTEMPPGNSSYIARPGAPDGLVETPLPKDLTASLSYLR